MASAGRPKALQKIIILGDTGVGKTSLMNRFVSDRYSSQYKATIGADFLTKNVQVGDRLVNLQIWDTAGQERFQSLGVAFYRGSDACVLVYDVTNAKSFRDLNKWRKEFLKNANPPDAESFPFVVLGNKVDVDADRHAVPEGKATKWCEELTGPIPHFAVSAKTGKNVEQAFLDVVTRASKRVKEDDIYVPDSLDFSDQDKAPEKGCDC